MSDRRLDDYDEIRLTEAIEDAQRHDTTVTATLPRDVDQVEVSVYLLSTHGGWDSVAQETEDGVDMDAWGDDWRLRIKFRG